MPIDFKQIAQIFLHFAMFGFSFYCLSGLDFAKVLLPSQERVTKAKGLLILASLALGYLSAQFLLAIMYHI